MTWDESKRKAYRRTYLEANRERHNALNRAWRKANPEKWREILKASRERHKHRNWGKQYLPRYGITKDQYIAQLTRQGGVCAICHCESRDGRRLCVDHEHDTSFVRGLLCTDCNTGKFFENPTILRQAATYFEQRGVWPSVEGGEETCQQD